MKKKLSFLEKPWTRRIVLILLVLTAVVLSALLAFSFVRGVVYAWSPWSQPGFVARQPTATGGSPVLDEEGAPVPVSENPSAPSSEPALTPWDGAGRVTVLLLGLDYRDWASGSDASRSDTMILLTMDPLTKTAGILSIPRDMWVAIPGFKHGKINTAYYLGEAYKLPGGGPGLAVKTVEQFIGVPINYYAQIDFGAFVRFIDEIGGVKIDVPEAITIDLLGDGSQTKKNLKPGVQVLPGEWALAYARNRKTEGGDFDRARRQQQVILGIRDRILDFNLLPTLIQSAPSLYRELSSGIHTNLQLDDAIKLAAFAQGIPDEKIQRGVIDQTRVLYGQSPDNLAILIPLPDKIHELRDEIFAASSGIGPGTPGSIQERMQAEAASLAVYDGSGTAGISGRTAEYLRSQGANVAQEGDADQSYSATTVVDHSGNPYTLQYLVDTLGVSPSRIYSEYDPSSSVEVEIYLGLDWARNNPLP